jgi:hypothetical protein
LSGFFVFGTVHPLGCGHQFGAKLPRKRQFGWYPKFRGNLISYQLDHLCEFGSLVGDLGLVSDRMKNFWGNYEKEYRQLRILSAI